MRKLIRFAQQGPTSFGLIVVIASILVGIGIAGCQQPPQRVAYNTIYSLETTVTATYDGYIAQVVKGTVSTNSLRAVSDAYTEFQLAATQATLLVQGNTNAPAPPALLQSANKVTTIITTAR